ncbi:GyrI-like domain-containing protein [Nanoarchaeota archaeon]
MEHVIKERGEFTVIGLQIETSVQECGKVLPGLWEEFMKREGEITAKKDAAVHYGVCKATSVEKCAFTAIATVEVEPDCPVPEGMVKETVPAAKYAVFEHKGPASTVGETYGPMMSYMPEHGLKQAAEEIWFERYDERFKNDADSVMEIWVPILE